MRDYLLTTVVAAALALVAGFEASASEARTALVIGVASYRPPDAPLRQPLNDARATASALRTIGFDIILREDPDRATLLRSIGEFSDRLAQRKGIGVLYFAGHGVQVAGRNYLLPVNAGLKSERDAPIRAIDVDEIVQRMRDSGARFNVVILDACRDNPLLRDTRSAAGESATPGFAPIRPPQGTLVAYSTEPGRVASDGKEGNSPYTRVLLRHIGTPGLTIEQLFKRVREDVARETGGRQVPVEYSMLTGADLVLVPAVAPAIVASTAPTVPPAPTSTISPPAPQRSTATQGNTRAARDNAQVDKWAQDEREIQVRAANLGADELRDLEGAARKGDPKSQVILGQVYHLGKIVPGSNKRAMEWFQRAADQKYPIGENLVGWMYLNGMGMPVDLEKAEYWFRLASSRGLLTAHQNLLIVTAQRRPNDTQAIIEELGNAAGAAGGTPYK